MRIEIPITIGTHGVRADDDPADEPDLRPLYTRAANQSGGGAEPVGVSALRRDISADDEDDIGEIDISLFEEGAGGGGWFLLIIIAVYEEFSYTTVFPP